MTDSIWQVVARLRRAQPRNPDTMALCDAYEAAMLRIRELEQKRERAAKSKRESRAKFDRSAYQREYMREYMRKRRAKAKAEK